MLKFKYIILHLIPVLFVMSIIFIASSQPYEQQDLKPILSELTDKNKLKELARSMLQEHRNIVSDLSSFVELDQQQAISFVLIPFTVFLLVLLIIFIKYNNDSFKIKLTKLFIYFILPLSIFSLFFLLVFRIDSVVGVIRNYASVAPIKAILQLIDFNYAGSQINMERLGIENFVQFLLRKFAHFFLFGSLGFFLFFAFVKAKVRNWLSVLLSFLIVMIYATFDELHQAITPNRTPLMEDIFLDTAGGITGILLALLLNKLLHNKKLT